MDAVLIIDCGATNVRVSAVTPSGNIVGTFNEKNSTVVGKEQANYHVWDLDEIWDKISSCSKRLLNAQPQLHILAIAVTTFGVDGAPYNSSNQAIYPIISWKCPRTAAAMETLKPHLEEIYSHSGVGEFSFNTLYKLVWLKENQPDIYAKMDKFVFISSMINHRLTGRVTTDNTMAGTSMLTDLKTRRLSDRILEITGLTGLKFADTVEAGETIGHLLPKAAQELGLSGNIPVISAGHDTQFALFAAGAEINEPVLSSGTWEILMVRSKEAQLSASMLDKGITTELDAIAGVYNPGVQWLSSGFLEWLSQLIYSDLNADPLRYDKMIADARSEPVGSRGVYIENSFLHRGETPSWGQIKGLSIESKRASIYRAALEYLGLQLRSSLTVLEKIGQFQTLSLICVGGGSRNSLLNQIRADIINCPIKVVQEAETTVIGAAMFAYAGSGYYNDINEARQCMKLPVTTVLPSEQHHQYSKLFPRR